MLLPVVGKGLVEGTVLLLGHLLGLASPDGLLLVHEIPLVGHLLHLLLLLFFLGLILLLIVLLLILVVVVVVVHLLVDGLLCPQRDRVIDEFGVLLYEVLEAALLDVLELILLQIAGNLRATAEGLSIGVLLHGERTASGRLPDPM